MDISNLFKAFLESYGENEEKVHAFFAPGRVNLIGEHTDYNNGFVLPCSLSFGTYLMIRRTDSPLLRFRSLNFDQSFEISLTDDLVKIGDAWVNYPLGVVRQFLDLGHKTGGFEFLYSGDIPNSAGLSSSASIEMVTAYALNELNGFGYSMIDLIKLSRKAENDFVGVSCGIMDQFAVGQGKKDHALFLNCGTLSFQHVPLRLKGYRLVIANTNKKRGLADSKYNERVRECRQALNDFRKIIDIQSLGELAWEDFLNYSTVIKDKIVLRRARHVVGENRRVLEAVKKLWHGDIISFGKLMNDSHDSLKSDYEVTGSELDALVYSAREQDGVIGARMTGAGFGGCTVNLVDEDSVERFIGRVGESYLRKTGLKANFYPFETSDGVKRII
jgi:galactokinase